MMLPERTACPTITLKKDHYMIKFLRLCIITALFTMMVVVLFAGAIHSDEKQDNVLKSKHNACVICHRMAVPPEKGLPAFPAGIDPVAFCLDCHHYTENHHPVNIAPTAAFPKDTSSIYPLYDGKITCLTCHEAHTGPGRVEPHELLRGGPHTDRRDICFRCHFKETYAKINPHIELAPGGTIREVAGKPVCLMCHSEMPKRDSGPDEVRFNADIAFLCWRCHPPMQGDFFQKHFHQKPSMKTLGSIREAERKLDIILPLAKDGRISCSTCHNPHQPGVLANRAALAGAGTPGRLRLSKDMMCSACHMQQRLMESKQSVP
jgi:predicted CXXCH cytochrome family protein